MKKIKRGPLGDFKQAGTGPSRRHIQGSKIAKKTSKCQVFSFAVLENRKFFEKNFSKKIHTQKNGPSGAPGPTSACPWRANVSQCRKTERGTLWGFSTFILSQNIKKLKGGKIFIFGKKSHCAGKNCNGGPFGIFQHPLWRKTAKKLKGDHLWNFFSRKKSRSAEKNERDPLVSFGMVCYAEKQEKPFWFSSLGQIVQFGAKMFGKTFKNYLGQFVWIKKRVTIIVAFHFMKRGLKIPEINFKNEIFYQCHSAEKCKRGPLGIFLTSIVLQNNETNEGKTLWRNLKNFKKVSLRREKNPSEKHQKGDILMFSRFCTSMFWVWTRFWRFEYVFVVRSSSWWFWTNEQKCGPISLNWRKKISHCRSREFSSKTPTKKPKTTTKEHKKFKIYWFLTFSCIFCYLLCTFLSKRLFRRKNSFSVCAFRRNADYSSDFSFFPFFKTNEVTDFTSSISWLALTLTATQLLLALEIEVN